MKQKAQSRQNVLWKAGQEEKLEHCPGKKQVSQSEDAGSLGLGYGPVACWWFWGEPVEGSQIREGRYDFYSCTSTNLQFGHR